MPRPKNKAELLDYSQKNFDRLLSFINDLNKDIQEREFPKSTLNRNVRDVLMHLHHWHLLMLDWYKIGMSGTKPDMPAKGYTWKTTSELNKAINEKYKDTSLKKAKSLLSKSHKTIREIIEKHSNEELFTKKKYKWTGSTSLGAYLVSSTSSHYDWALKLIKKSTK